MEVLITHGWSEENAGDYAIEKSIIKVLDDISSEKNNYTFYSLFDKNDPRLMEHNTLKSKKDNINIIPSIWATPPIQYSTMMKVFYIFHRFIKFLFLNLFLSLGIAIDKRIKDFKKADLIVVKGGTFVYSIPGPRGIIFALRILLPIIIAVKLGKKTIIAPHSFGPFENNVIDPYIFKYLKKLDWIYCREEVSVELLKSKGINNVSFLPDMAFYLDGKQKSNLDEKLNIGITARPLDFVQHNKEAVYANYINSISNFIEEMISNNNNVNFQLIPQVIGPDPREDDAETLKLIFDKLSAKAKEQTILVPKQLREPEELIDIYSNLELIIGTRMHSIIFGLLSGVRPIAISYLGPKHIGIMQGFGIGEYVIDIETINTEYLISKTNEILKRDLKEQIIEQSNIYKKLIFKEFSKAVNEN